MPCRECGESAKKHGGACIGLTYDDGNARYYCLNCTITALEDTLKQHGNPRD